MAARSWNRFKRVLASVSKERNGPRKALKSSLIYSSHGAILTDHPNPKWFDFNTTFHLIKFQVPKNDDFLAVLASSNSFTLGDSNSYIYSGSLPWIMADGWQDMLSIMFPLIPLPAAWPRQSSCQRALVALFLEPFHPWCPNRANQQRPFWDLKRFFCVNCFCWRFFCWETLGCCHLKLTPSCFTTLGPDVGTSTISLLATRACWAADFSAAWHQKPRVKRCNWQHELKFPRHLLITT